MVDCQCLQTKLNTHASYHSPITTHQADRLKAEELRLFVMCLHFQGEGATIGGDDHAVTSQK